MVIVVPAFTERDEREQQAIATFIARVKATLSKNVREGVDEERSVEKDRRADKETPHQQLPASYAQSRSEVIQSFAKTKKGKCQTCRDHEVEAVQEDKLGIFREITNDAVVGGEIFTARHPSDVRPPKTGERRGMHVVFSVRMLVMMPMDRRPPQRAALHRRVSEHREEELTDSRCLECAMRKVAMIKAGDCKHPNPVKQHGDRNSSPAPSHPNDAKAAEVNEDKREAPPKLEGIRTLPDRVRSFGKIVRVKPLPHRDEQVAREW